MVFFLSPVFLLIVFYPISILPAPWEGLSRLNPLFYLIEGFRYALLGEGDIAFGTAFGAAAAMAAVLFGWAAWPIGRGYKLRN